MPHRNSTPLYFLLLLSFFLFSSMQPAFALNQTMKERIAHLVRSNPGQLSAEEYSLIAKTILNQSPCNVLVFGLGRDSSLWMDCNQGGFTVFLENNKNWLEKIQFENPSIIAYRVEYGTLRSQWKELLHQPENLYLDVPEEILSTPWDIIFVDAPTGFADNQPGRMKSIYMASILTNNHQAHVFVHDCNRIVEAAYCDEYLKPANLVQSIHRLRHYFIRSKIHSSSNKSIQK